MKTKILIMGAVALAFGPGVASAQTPPGSQYNGNGYWHTNSGNANGQPNQSCEDDRIRPVRTRAMPGAPVAVRRLQARTALEARIMRFAAANSRNTASVSQYDVACSNQQPL